MSGRASWDLEPCGTPAAYRRHKRHGEQPCPPCRRASQWRRTQAEAYWHEQDHAAQSAYKASVAEWQADHETSLRRRRSWPPSSQQERDIRTAVALIAEVFA